MSKKFYTTADIAKLFDVYTTTVADWIDSGKLTAFKTAGGHRRVRPDDLHTFLKNMQMPIPEGLKSDLPVALVIDDDSTMRRLLKRHLNKLGVTAVLAGGGFEGLIKLGQAHPKLVILDIMMPDLNGFKVCEDIRSMDEFKGIGILAISANDTPKYRKKIIECGANAFLAKPFEYKELESNIREILDEQVST